ncbi:MAG: HD domain-containing protein [Proteobacteria bacterium]|nr:MAG: HD domain-containing protein [Pseudomonadota bacterium]
MPATDIPGWVDPTIDELQECSVQTVDFIAMKDGRREEYELLRELESVYVERTADRLVRELSLQDEDTMSGYRVTRLEHALQSATRARRDEADADWIVAALLHDIGDRLAPRNHDRFAAEIIRPFVREEVTWVVAHHGAFQMVYYAHHFGWDRYARDAFSESPYYRSCVDFCERWDQASFDPDYASDSLESFEAAVREVFDRKPFDPQILRSGVALGLCGSD